MQKNTKLFAKFDNVTQFNSQFSKAKVYIAYHGDNRNFTSISKETFEDMISSLYGVPVVGEWIEQVDDEDGGTFGSHGGKIEISEDGVKYIQTTKPIGFVGQDADVYWETITEEDGQENEYLVASPVYLWSGRYPEAETILKNQNGQSMEINVFDSNLRDDGYFEIKKAEFSALCVLGNVEPCFESSRFKQFNLDKETFKAEFNLMVKELKQSAFEGGEGVGEKFKEEVETTEETFEETTEDVEETTVDASEEVSKAEETTEEFTDEEVTETTEIEDVESKEVVETETEVEKDFEAEETLSLEDYNQLLADYEILKAENEELKSFKADILSQQRTNEVEEVFAKYSTLLDASDYEDLKEKVVDMDIDMLEKELSFRLVQKKFDFSKITKKDSTKITIKEDKDAKEPYGSASIYFNK